MGPTHAEWLAGSGPYSESSTLYHKLDFYQVLWEAERCHFMRFTVTHMTTNFQFQSVTGKAKMQ